MDRTRTRVDRKGTLDAVETNLSRRDHRQNQVMKKVTSWAAIIAVPTLVTGDDGMNVPCPGFARTWGLLVSPCSWSSAPSASARASGAATRCRRRLGAGAPVTVPATTPAAREVRRIGRADRRGAG